MKPKILILDDNKAILVSMSFMLQDHFQVLWESDGQAGIECLQADQDIELVITDVEMPKADGFEVLQWAKTHRPELPVIVTSGKDHKDEALKQGAVYFLPKPGDLDLVELIKHFLKTEITID